MNIFGAEVVNRLKIKQVTYKRGFKHCASFELNFVELNRQNSARQQPHIIYFFLIYPRIVQ